MSATNGIPSGESLGEIFFPESDFPLPLDTAFSFIRKNSRPVSYDEAVESVKRINWDERIHHVSEAEQTLLFTTGQKTTHTMLILNGIGETPTDFLGGAQRVHALGWNVLVPRLPRHGGDEPYGAIKNVTLDDLLLCIEESVPIASQLGEKLVIAGASLGALMTGISAVRFPELVSDALLVQPPVSIVGIPDAYRSVVIDIVRFCKDSSTLPVLNTRAPGGSSHGVATGGELALFLESLLSHNDLSDGATIHVRYDESDPMFGSECGKKVLGLLQTKNKNLGPWNFPFHTITGENPDWTPAYTAIFEQLEKFAKEVEARAIAREKIELFCKTRGFGQPVADELYDIMAQDDWLPDSFLFYLNGFSDNDDPIEYFRRGTDCTRY